MFFVLSGFLITTILLNTRESPQYFSSFYMRRVLRIFPLYFAAIFAFFHILLPLMHRAGQMLDVSSAPELWYWLYASNWRQGLGAAPIWHLSHFWSLAIEEQFYLVWPAVVYLLSARQLRNACGVLIAGGLGLRGWFAIHGASAEFLHSITFLRLDTLAFGALVALLRHEQDQVPQSKGAAQVRGSGLGHRGPR